ncbi:hypothetical protein ACET3Z_021216 [Daucus carota]
MKKYSSSSCTLLLLFTWISLASPYDGPLYDFSAYTECKLQPEQPLYGGGVIGDEAFYTPRTTGDNKSILFSPAFVLHNITQGTIYSFSVWVKIDAAESASIKATLMIENTTDSCIGSVSAKRGCWSFLKGGFISRSPHNTALINFQSSDARDIDIQVRSASLQPFTEEQWRFNQQYKINTERKRAVTIHVSDKEGIRLQGATIHVEQISRDYPFGSAIAKSIIGNTPYQKWFVERFNAAVFENELKWYATEAKQGQLNYTLADKMLEFIRANQITVRGHNIFWEDPKYIPNWLLNLTASGLQSAVNSRIQSLMSKYRNDFIHWDVNNENLHYDFYEKKLGPNATLDFFKTVHTSDPLATLFLNDYNVVETCNDVNSTVDKFILKIDELKRGGAIMDGIGLESHFTVPNLPLMRAILDKFATLGLPIWLTEVDISNKFDHQTQALYLEQVLREGFAHPSVNGIMLWTALSPKGCYQMCLTDDNFNNLPAGDVVDKLLKEWQTGTLESRTNEQGSYSFYGFFGEYKVTAQYGNSSSTSTFSLCRGDETKHYNIQL